MKIKEDIKPISYLKSRSADLLAQINETHRPVIITQNGEPRAVIQDAESYEKMVTSLNLMRILAHSEKDIQEGNTVKQEALFKQIRDDKLKPERQRNHCPTLPGFSVNLQFITRKISKHGTNKCTGNTCCCLISAKMTVAQSTAHCSFR